MGFWGLAEPEWGQKPSGPVGSRAAGWGWGEGSGGSAQTCLPQMPGKEPGRVGKVRPPFTQRDRAMGRRIQSGGWAPGWGWGRGLQDEQQLTGKGPNGTG